MVYSEYNKDVDDEDFKFYEYEFNSLAELINFIDNNEPYKQWYSSYYNNVLASEKKDYDFNGTKNIEEAKMLCLKGNSKEIDDFITLNEELKNQFLFKSQRRNFVEDVYGSRLQISKVLTGNPKSMMRLIRNEPLKYVNVWVNCSCNCGTERNAITNRGIIISNMIKLLENNGYKVNLNFYFLARKFSGNAKEAIYIKVNIKNPGEKLDLSSTYFPLCHPSFLRRLIFAVMERTNCDGAWKNGYGTPVNNVEDFITIQKNDIIVKEPNYVEVYGYDLLNDTISLFNNVNFCDYIAPGKKLEYNQTYQKIVFVDAEEKGYSNKIKKRN